MCPEVVPVFGFVPEYPVDTNPNVYRRDFAVGPSAPLTVSSGCGV